MATKPTTTKKIKKSVNDLIACVGRRKTAVARVFLYQDKGDFTINDKPIADYFPGEKAQLDWMKPFHLIGVSHPGSKFRATIKVSGSGKSAQLEAVVLAVSRALSRVSEEFSLILKKNDLLTRDPRMVERKKPYLRKARKSPQYSKR